MRTGTTCITYYNMGLYRRPNSTCQATPANDGNIGSPSYTPGQTGPERGGTILVRALTSTLKTQGVPYMIKPQNQRFEYGPAMVEKMRFANNIDNHPVKKNQPINQTTTS